MFSETCKLIDLTHLITPHIPTWDSEPVFKLDNNFDYDDGARVQSFEMQAGTGTHMDAPSHFIKGSLDISDIPLSNLFTSVFVVDVSSKADANYKISLADIHEFENIYGTITENSFVIGFTGWSKFWPDLEKYASRNSSGERQFPCFSKQAAEYLLQKKIVGIGIDTLSVDCEDNFVHQLILNNNCYIVENLANCHLVPPSGAQIVLLPLNIKDATESPIRAVALIPNIKK